jgi:hypothetical protein
MDTAKKALFFTLGAAVAVCVVIFAFLLRPGEIGDTGTVPLPTRAVAVQPQATTATEGGIRGAQATSSHANVKVDRNGRCHNPKNGQFVKCPW